MARARFRLALAALVALAAGCTIHWQASDGVPIQPPADLPDLGALQACGSESSTALEACVDRARLSADVATVARPRPSGSEQSARVRAMCAQRFRDSGFEVEEQDYGGGVNVIGTRRGQLRPDERLLVSAHYDSVKNCAGADDNASGVAALFEAARVLGMGRFERTLVVACWDQHEPALHGASAYVERAVTKGEKLALALVLDSIGYTSSAPGSQRVPASVARAFPEALAELDASGRRADFVTVLCDAESRAFAQEVRSRAARVGLRSIVLELGDREKAQTDAAHRSDHQPFWLDGFAATLLTDSGDYRNPGHGCRGGGSDTAGTLDYEFLEHVTSATVGALATTLGVRD